MDRIRTLNTAGLQGMNKVLRYGVWLWLASLLSIALAASPADRDASPPDRAGRLSNKGVVGIITGGVSGTYIRIAADMAAVLDNPTLRVLTIVGQGSIQNIDDLLYLKGIDMAIVQSDVLEYLKRQNTYSNIDKKISYITKLYNEEFHLIAKGDINNLEDLTGKKVNFDVKGSGTAITASILFDTLKMRVEPTHYDQATALEKLKNGEISALAYVAGKPVTLFEKITAAENLHLLAIDYSAGLLDTYPPAAISHQDYPNLIPGGEEIRTIAVSAVLAVYQWHPRKVKRHKKVADFATYFLEHLNDFQKPPRHPKWREVSLSATLPGWTRFPAVEQWLQTHR
ncbi:MAG: TAXI family TRAP transporter solute-binding subunit [Candidatus Competibacter sp.]|nr:TAXI family TRAP transporter solute-binding subunit [Candidatus Competibacteraceae bacterium]